MNTDNWAGSIAGTVRELSEHPPKRWTAGRIEDLLTLEYGENLPSGEREEGRFPVYGSSGQVGTHSAPAVGEAGLIIGRKGSIGDVVFSGDKFWPIDTTYYVGESDTALNIRYLQYLLSSLQLDSLNAASAIPGLNRSDAYNLRVAVPPFDEQRKIASVLYSVDCLIETNRSSLRKVDRLRRSLARELFEKGAFEHSGYSEGHHRSRLTRYPASWDVVPAGDVMRVSRGAHPRPKSDATLWGGNIPIIKIGDRDKGDGRIISDTSDYVTEKGAKDSKLVQEGTLLVSNAGTCGVARITGQESCVHDHWLILKEYEDSINPRYLFHYINYNQGFLSALATGSTVDDLNTDDFRLFDIAIPALQEQVIIADILDDWHDFEAHIKRTINRTRRLKAGLMQDLLTGEVRTDSVEIEIPEEVAAYG